MLNSKQKLYKAGLLKVELGSQLEELLNSSRLSRKRAKELRRVVTRSYIHQLWLEDDCDCLNEKDELDENAQQVSYPYWYRAMNFMISLYFDNYFHILPKIVLNRDGTINLVFRKKYGKYVHHINIHFYMQSDNNYFCLGYKKDTESNLTVEFMNYAKTKFPHNPSWLLYWFHDIINK